MIPDDRTRLEAEIVRLRTLLLSHGISPDPVREHAPSQEMSPAAKISLFKKRFRGRTDLYAIRWESSRGKGGYAPACTNEWKPGICEKPRVKCADCQHRLLSPLTDDVIRDHLTGRKTIGVYPLLPDDTCCFLAIDFDGNAWREDAGAALRTCREEGIPASLEISRSGEGAHLWFFFEEPVQAREARRLGEALISRTCRTTRLLALSSYDRLFPSQDTLPKGGFGNLIALPLQKKRRERGHSVFVDDNLHPYPDQWTYLASIAALSRVRLSELLHSLTEGRPAVDVFVEDDLEEPRPWERSHLPEAIQGPLPSQISLVLSGMIFFEKKEIPPALQNRLIRLAAFQNPEFYRCQAMRLPIWNKPRVIGCAEHYPQHIALPRGCLEPVLDLLARNGITPLISDQRVAGRRIRIRFLGRLKSEQKKAAHVLLDFEAGILSAPTGFGKTVVAAAVIAKRKTSTLILVHRTDLLRQWRERLSTLLTLKTPPGVIGGGKKSPTGTVDIAVMQSLIRMPDLPDFLDQYGQIIIDECHHLSAVSFESLLKKARARYVVGLTATLVRRDAHHPIVLMQCGPVRHQASSPHFSFSLEVRLRTLSTPPIPSETEIWDIFRGLCEDPERNRIIAKEIEENLAEGRKILVLSERADHLERIRAALPPSLSPCFLLHGRLPKKERLAIFASLSALDDSSPRVLLATGRLVGEGFDHPPLDTLLLALPISWRGTLAQYAGRLHREHSGKGDLRIIDYLDGNHPIMNRMWSRRKTGYRLMGYRIIESESPKSE